MEDTAVKPMRRYALSELMRIAKGETLPDEFKEARPLKLLRLDAIQTRRFRSRVVLNEAHIRILAQRIQADGLHQPITVRPVVGASYELITGHCRWEAYKRLQRKVIPAIVHPSDDRQAAWAALYDNLLYKTLSDFELFKGFQQLLELDPTLSVQAIAQEIGWPSQKVKRMMAFAQLPDSVQVILNADPDLLSARVAYELAKQTVCGYGRTVVEAVQLIQQGKLLKSRAAQWIHAHIDERSLSNGNRINGKAACPVIPSVPGPENP